MKNSARWISQFFDQKKSGVFVTLIVLSSSCTSDYTFEQSPITDSQKNRNNFTTDNIPTGTQASLKKYKSALAVRGAQCMVCHASLQTTIITDFGYGSSNFASTALSSTNVFKEMIQVGPNGHYTNENAYSNQRDAWQSANEISGSVVIPKININDNLMETMVGVRTTLSMKELMESQTLTGSGSMTSKITSSEKVIEKNSIEISYPSKSEILSLIPTIDNNASTLIYKKTLSGAPTTIADHLIVDSSRDVIRNDFSSTIVCKGDVVLKGTLLLKNATISTNKNGCRLYVTEGVHIQGPLSIIGENGEEPNVQITSSKAILLGFSGDSMGASQSGGASGSRADIFSDLGGRLARFAKRLDTQYNPSLLPINGVASETFFNELTSEAVRLGDYLEDAEDAVVNNHIPTGASIVNGRLSIQFSKILFNAPHVHSRYYGDIEGAVIAEVAFFARNPVGQNLERFVYDSVFDSAPAVLPALSRQMLTIK